jgi:hypothetical protein
MPWRDSPLIRAVDRHRGHLLSRYYSAVTQRALAVAATLLLTLLIAGCAPESGVQAAGTTPTPATTAETPPAVGSSVDVETATRLSEETEGQLRGYPMPDGSYLVVDRSAPLPEPVQEDINKKGAAAIEPTLGSPKDSVSPAALSNRQKVMGEVEALTGKDVVFGLRVTTFATAEATTPTTWYIFNGPFRSPEPNYPTREGAEAAVNEWLASQPNPDDIVVMWG